MIYLFNVKKELNKIIPRTNLISFIQELEINGLYLSEVELPLFYKTEYGQYYNHKKTFDSASFFGFFDTKKKFQLYKIHTRKVDGRLLIVSGVHLFFDEAKAMSVVRDKRLIDVDAASATNTVFNGTGWTVKSSDVTPLKSIDFYYQTPQEARSRIIESWNIEFDYDLTFDGKKITSKNIYIKKKLGVWTGDRYSYGTNILSIVQEQDEAEVFTAAIGRGTSDDTNTALNAKVLFDDLSWSKDGYTKPLGQDYIEIPSATAQYGYYDSNGNVKPRIAVIDFEDIQDQKILADKTYEWLKQNCVPKVSYQTTVAKAGDYYLGDEIGIIYKDIDIVKKARVEKIKVNMLNPKLSELGLGDYQFFKQDRFKKNIRNEISTVKKDTLTGIQKIRQEFSDQFDVTKQEWEAQIQQVEINAAAQVQAAETRMNEQLSSAKSELSGQISNSYNSAVQAAELKAKELDAVVTNQINSTKTTLSNDITSAYNKAVTDAETKAKALDAAITQTVTANKQAADKTIGELNSALGSTNSKVGTIEQNVTAVKDSVNAISQWKADKGTAIDQTIDAVSTKAWMTDINPITKRVETAEASITTNANEILKRVTKTEFDSTTGRIEGVANTAKSTAESNTTAITTVSGKVDALEQWRTDKGTAIDQTIDAVTTKVWQNDIDALNFENRNLLLDSANVQMTSNNSSLYPIVNGISSEGFKTVQRANVTSNPKTLSCYTQHFFPVYKVGTYTQQIKVRPASDIYMSLYGGGNDVLCKGNEWTTLYRYISITTVPADNRFRVMGLMSSTNDFTVNNPIIEYKESKVEFGSKATPYSIAPEDAENRMTEIKQTADGALTKATTIGNDYVKQSAVLVQSDGVLIGSKKVSGAEMASAISVTPSSVDIITKAMRITGDMTVAGDIKSLSLSAVYADIANLRANVITADSVTSTALKVDTALIQKLNTNALLTNYLTADTAMINSIKSNALTAVRADIAWLKANVITADSISSTALKVDTALMDKLNVNSILTNKLLADTAMINAIKSNAITAVRGDIAYLKANIITADSITSTALKADVSMINKLFAQDAYITALTSKSAFIKEIQAIEVIAYRLEARDKQASVNIENGSITMNRDNGSRMDISLNGIQSFNSGGSLLFSLTPTLVTTSAVGTSVSNVYLGTAPNAEARVVNMNGIPGDGEIGSYAYRPIRTLAIKFPLKANGYIGIDGNELRIMSDGLVEGGYKSVRADKGYFSTVDANNEIGGAHFYIRPKRGGELRATYNDGGDTSYANFRSDGIYAPWIDYNGHIPGSHFYIRPAYGGEVRLTATGTTNNWANLRSDGIYAPWIDFNGQISGSHLYIRPGSGGEVKFTRTGTTDVWANIRFGSWNAMSHEKYKNSIQKWDYNVLDIYRNELVLHSYKVNSEAETLYDRIHHGIVLRENPNLDQFPVEWRNGNGFDGNEVLWWNTKATQELAFENVDLKNDVTILKKDNAILQSKLDSLENRLKILEDKLNG